MTGKSEVRRISPKIINKFRGQGNQNTESSTQQGWEVGPSEFREPSIYALTDILDG